MILKIILIGVIGTLLHFTYEFSHHNKFVAIFSAVNESTWEHIKIALTPTFLYALFEGFRYMNNNSYIVAVFLSLLTIIIMIPVFFYSYTFFTRKAILPVDVISFWLTIIISQVVFNTIMKFGNIPNTISYFGILGIFTIFGFYMIATLAPLKNTIFKDPITKNYGIKGHSHLNHKH